MSPPKQIAQYRVLKQLGEGSFGSVFMAEGEVPGKVGRSSKRQMVAIKQLHGDFDMRSFETLVNEYELLDRVNHRSLCKVYQFLDREMALVMECVNGQTLRTVIDATSLDPAWPDAVVEIGAELADGLYRAWNAPTETGRRLGMVHLDLKPENVMLTPLGEIRILDLGLARADDGTVREPAGGTPLYMAPEQARGEDVGHTSDLFSLGLILFELLMNRPAYMIPDVPRASRIQALLQDIERGELSESVVALKRRWPKIGQVVAKCLDPDPDKRPVDGHHLMISLQECSSSARGGGVVDYARWLFDERVKVPDRRFRSTNSRKAAKVSREGKATMGNNPARPGNKGPKRPTSAVRPSTNSRPRANRPPSASPGAAPQAFSTGGDTWSPPAPEPKATRPAKKNQNLRMVPLARDDGPSVVADDEEIFVQLKRPEIVPVEPKAGPPGVVVAGGAPPVPFGAVPMMGAPIAAGIQGPVANGPMAAAPGFSPMAPASMHGMQVNPGAAAPETRAKSYRVFVAVLGLISLVFGAALVVVMAVAFAFIQQNSSGEDVAKDTTRNGGRQPIQAPAAFRDTAIPPSDATPAKQPEPVRSTPSRSRDKKKRDTKPASGKKPTKTPKETKPPEEEAPAVAPGGRGNLTMNFTGSIPFTGATIDCEDGTRKKSPIVGSKLSFSDVPATGCTVNMRGASATQFRFGGGTTVTCSLNASNRLTCH